MSITEQLARVMAGGIIAGNPEKFSQAVISTKLDEMGPELKRLMDAYTKGEPVPVPVDSEKLYADVVDFIGKQK